MDPENAASSIVRMAEHKKVQTHKKAALQTILKPRKMELLFRIE
jgi:hypothetical protein